MEKEKEIWIIGYGKFGQRAVREIIKTRPASRCVIVDAHSADQIPKSSIFIKEDAVSWLAKHLHEITEVDTIVPAVPLHLAAEWLKIVLVQTGCTVRAENIPETVLSTLPNCYQISPSVAALSYADFLCPENCPEPEGYCTITKEKRTVAMYELLKQCDFPTPPYVIRSCQLAPGVGGYRKQELLQLLHHAQLQQHSTIFVATSCKCHGIVSGLRFSC